MTWKADLERRIARLRKLALSGAGIAAAALVCAPLLAGCAGASRSLAVAVAALAILMQAAHLAFDGLLFRLSLARETEAEGMAAIDETLAAMRLRPLPPHPAPLAARLAGTDRIVRRHLVLTVFGLILSALLFAVHASGAARC